MTFNLRFDIPSSSQKITLDSKVITIGSCFSDVVGQKLFETKINTEVNPFGIVYNPSSIFKILNKSINNESIESDHFCETESRWMHYDFHSKNNDISKIVLKSTLETRLKTMGEKLLEADLLVITFGTSFAYQYLETKKYISNCHKMPANLFRKDLLHVKHICQEFEHFYKNIKDKNQRIKIILTVSPVRHTKDGTPENQVSKSILRAACHYLSIDFKDVMYFPAYEIMMDELRDYRFYANDMIHPNKLAEDYIFKRFADCYFDQELMDFTIKWSNIKKELNHKPFDEKSPSHQLFLKKLLKKLEEISQIVNVEMEKEAILSRIFA